ncbi:hypothetical protein NLX67_00570 [Domibacillus sp. A3M-37]|uniref:hypothetical protein n=1 Tax=Domibacillus TaxID=1433999 RepID=UPI0020B7E59B|nr:hypothetical protein [Domibacillus sp. A3M-37]MCP3760888.1 hypothetical protein [Domibacillus sp. A3M-37]
MNTINKESRQIKETRINFGQIVPYFQPIIGADQQQVWGVRGAWTYSFCWRHSVTGSFFQ